VVVGAVVSAGGVAVGVGVGVGVGLEVGVDVGVGLAVGVDVGVGAGATVMLYVVVPVCPEPGVPFTPYTLYVYAPGAFGALRLAVSGEDPGPAARFGLGVVASLFTIQKPVFPLELSVMAMLTLYASPGARVVLLGVALTLPIGVALWHDEQTDL
jgi:hypothetical protein